MATRLVVRVEDADGKAHYPRTFAQRIGWYRGLVHSTLKNPHAFGMRLVSLPAHDVQRLLTEREALTKALCALQDHHESCGTGGCIPGHDHDTVMAQVNAALDMEAEG